MASVLVIGSGGREHALSWKLLLSNTVSHVYVCPGNAGTGQQEKTTNISLNVKDHVCISSWCKEHQVDLVIVGPEDPLADGLADHLKEQEIACFGPSAASAQIEASKAFSKDFMDRHNIPTAKWKSFTESKSAQEFIMSADFPALVVKASGLAAGKGVLVCSTKAEACKAVCDVLDSQTFGSAGSTVVVEELLTGYEVSALAFTDGVTVRCFPPAQDHKQIYDGDKGPNTGGMGAYCPCYDGNTEVDTDYIQKEVVQKAVDGMRKDGTPYVGVLYAGLMITKDGPKVLEFNCRFGDPETQVLLPLMQSDLYTVAMACVKQTLHNVPVEFYTRMYAVAVVSVSEGYPGAYNKGVIISGLNKLEPNVLVFHAGTAIKDGQTVTSGGRVLATVATSDCLKDAAEYATDAAEKVEFQGKFYRKDIAHKSIKISSGLTYSEAGVDIIEGERLVESIKEIAASTSRLGCTAALGGFGGVFDMSDVHYSDPLLVSGTDGVGTKLKIAQLCGIHDTIGEDLVAMCVNDILAHGAEPFFFLDYFACGHLEVDVARDVVKGVAEGCIKAGCALLGGETAEMPGMYSPGEYDLAGFTVGAVERENCLPRTQQMRAGDLVIGIASTGIHSNGYSLVRRIVEKSGLKYTSPSPFDQEKTLGESLLVPTQIYIKSLLPLLQAGHVKAFAHITGGGLPGNLSRVLGDWLAAEIHADQWNIQPVFGWLANMGGVQAKEMAATFNCGVGACLIVDPATMEELEELIKTLEDKPTYSVIGKLIERTDVNSDQVVIHGLDSELKLAYTKCRNVEPESRDRVKVAVLISGSGTNLQALIDSTQSFDSVAEIVLVISNKPNVQGLERAEKTGIRSKVIKHRDFSSREMFDAEMHKELIASGVEIVCLAGFMRILSGEFVRKWDGRLINIHPSLLPSFKGSNAHEQVLAAGVCVTGCTVHFVVEEVDAGAIIAQETMAVKPDDTIATLSERVKTVEHVAYPRALKLLAEKKVCLNSGKCQWSL